MHNEIDEKVTIAIIGGTGVYDANLLTDVKKVEIDTPYGEPSDPITIGSYYGKRIAFLARHGADHRFPPHKVPYRANIWALKELGVERIIAPCAVGSLREDVPPGDIVITDQFVDYTRTRDYTFYDGPDVKHISVHDPLCSELREIAVAATEELGFKMHKTGTAVVIEGPRYSTRAESIFFKDILKADIIGMTLVPEAQLARELDICYVSVASSTDYDAWSDQPVTAQEVVETMKENVKKIRAILQKMVVAIPDARTDKCQCAHASGGAGH